jgi:hypothetical protein
MNTRSLGSERINDVIDVMSEHNMPLPEWLMLHLDGCYKNEFAIFFRIIGEVSDVLP